MSFRGLISEKSRIRAHSLCNNPNAEISHTCRFRAIRAIPRKETLYACAFCVKISKKLKDNDSPAPPERMVVISRSLSGMSTSAALSPDERKQASSQDPSPDLSFLSPKLADLNL